MPEGAPESWRFLVGRCLDDVRLGTMFTISEANLTHSRFKSQFRSTRIEIELGHPVSNRSNRLPYRGISGVESENMVGNDWETTSFTIGCYIINISLLISCILYWLGARNSVLLQRLGSST